MRILILLTFALALSAPSIALAQSAEQRAKWNGAREPFRIAGNLYYVGTSGLSAYLITGPRGHVLIDGALPESAPLIAANIRKLGFKLSDVKYLLSNHSHVDHAGGLAELKRLTGARMVASAADKPDLEAGTTIGRTDIADFPAVKVDRLIGDGERLTLGPTMLTAILTPGHTKGATSWMTRIDGKSVIFASSISVAGQKLIDNPDYPNAAADFRASFAKLKALKADIFLSYHAEAFALDEKRTRAQAGAKDAFADAGELARQVDLAEKAFEATLAKQRAASNSG
jgi:metallo-beta-lactamase class B